MPFYLKRLRLPAQDYRGRRIYFISICCADRRPFFTDFSTGHWALSQLSVLAPKHFFSLHSFCLMPDHLHFLAEGMAVGDSIGTGPASVIKSAADKGLIAPSLLRGQERAVARPSTAFPRNPFAPA